MIEGLEIGIKLIWKKSKKHGSWVCIMVINKLKQSCSVLHMRHADPLNEFVDRDDKLCTEIDIPIADFDPRYVFWT